MGYTHYWRREKEIEQSKFNDILIDFKKVLPEIEKAGVQLADGRGEETPIFNSEEIIFNGKAKCGHKVDERIIIPWPTKNAGGVANNWKEDAKKGNWFAGAEIEKRVCNGDCSYETFSFPRVFKPESWSRPEEGLYFEFCKTAFRPYDFAVIAFLIIAKHHLQEKIKVSSDGEDQHWFDGKMLCQMILGYGFEYRIDKDGELILIKEATCKK